jgi:imidazoleglycerol-phosphate dehydratase
MNLHIHVLYGQDKHHVVEAVFKGVARSLSRAVAITGTSIPSTKGIL